MRLKTNAVARIMFASMLSAVGSASAQTTISLSSWLPPTHAVSRALADWAKEVESNSGGRLKFNMLPKAVSSPPGTLDAIRDGVADVSWTVDGYTPGRFLLTRVVEFPLLGNSADVMSVAYQRIHERYFAKADEHKGVRVLAVFAHGSGDIYTTNKAVKTISDLKGLKIRIGGGVVSDVMKQLGVNALAKPASEIYELLSSGVADGFTGSADGVNAFKLERLIKYYTHIPGGLHNTSFSVFMFPATYDKLAPQDRAAIDKASGERLARRIGEQWKASDEAGIAALKQAGAEMIVADSAFVEELRNRTRVLEDNWISAVKAKGVDGRAVLKELREEIRMLESRR